MNTKKWVITSLVIFVVATLLDFVIHMLILGGAYEATSHIWRPEAEMNSMMWFMWLSGLIWSFLFVYIFAKGYEGRGIMEGVRFGLVIGLFFMISMSLGNYVTLPIPFSLALYWFIFGVIEIIILGILASILYKPVTAPAATEKTE
jgi:hypothetical protein